MIHRAPSTSKRLFITLSALAGSLCLTPMNCLAKEFTLNVKTEGSQRLIAVRRKFLTPAYTERLPEQFKSPPVNIRAVSNLGYIVTFQPPLSPRRGQPYLLSIPGISLRNRPPQDVMPFLQGKPGSAIRIQVINYDGKREEIDLLIPAEDEANVMFSTEEFFYLIERSNNDEFHSNLLEQTQTNNDLLAKGYCSDSARECKTSLDNGSNTLTTIIQCLAVSQAIGDLDGADKYLQLALSALNDTSRAKIRTFNFPLFTTITNLVALGKVKEAVEICRTLASPSYQQAPEHLDPFKILECLLAIRTSESLVAQFELIERLYPIYSVEHPPNTQNLLWFGQLLERIDKTPERSLKLYSIEERLLRKIEDPQPTFVSCQKLAACLYVKAQAEARLGKTEQSAKDLAAITDYYKEKLPIDQYNLLDQLPLYFPTPAHVAAAQGALPGSQSIAKFHPFPCEPWYESGSKDNFAGFYSPPPMQLIHTNQCFAAIKSNDRSKALDFSKQLLHTYRYQQADNSESYVRIRQNLFCTILRISRAFSDRGWTIDSDYLLNELNTIIAAKDLDPGWAKMAVSMVRGEQVVNSLTSENSVNKKLEATVWEDFENNYLYIAASGSSIDTKRISVNYEKCKRLRLLAMNYSLGGEYKRAKLFYDRALLVEPDLITDQEMLGHIEQPLEERYLLRINIAIFLAKTGDYSGADKYIQLAKDEKPSTNQNIVMSLVKTANTFDEVGQIDRAIDLMKNILASNETNQFYSSEQLKAQLATLLFKKGNSSEAVKLVDQTTTTGNLSDSAPNYIRAAEAAKLEKDYTSAANFFNLAAGTFSHALVYEQALPLLRSAIACAEQAKNFDNDTLATYYLSLANKSGALKADSIKLREKAQSIMSDTNPKKPEVISTNAYLRRESIKEALPRELRNKQPPYVYKDSDTIKARIAMLPQPSADELESNLQAATLAAQNKLPDAGDYWMRLADSEALAKKFDLACTHARLAIGAYNKTDPRATKREQIIGSNGVAVFLAVAGAPELGRILFREALARVKEIQGPSSLATQMQLAQYFDFCVGEKDNFNSLNVLDELLATDLNQGAYGAPNPGESICTLGAIIPIRSSFEAISIVNTTVSECFKQKEFAFGQLAAEKLIAAERKQFPHGDYRTALTLEIQARGYADAGDNTNAEVLYREAKPTLVKHGSWGNDIDAKYRKVLQAVSKQDEVDKMDADAFTERAEIIKREEARK